MWPFGHQKIAPDDLKRVNILEEKVDSLMRRMHSMAEDLEEFYAKVNKARQRVVAAEKRESAHPGEPVEESRAVMKERLRRNIRGA